MEKEAQADDERRQPVAVRLGHGPSEDLAGKSEGGVAGAQRYVGQHRVHEVVGSAGRGLRATVVG